MNPERWQRIKDVAAAAFELQGDARTRFLDKECGSDPELRRAVEEFLEGDQQPGDTLERAIAGAAVQLTRRARSRHADPHPGQTISHYSVLEKLGEGGMGVVYRAEDTKLKRPVALKFLRSDLLEDSEHKARFLREAQAAASLIHSNICVIHEIDESEGSPFMAMELVEGETVKAKIKARPLKLNEALDIAIQTAQGLQAAHEKGIVHRDIKCANLMVTPQGRVKIMDFGLARLAERSQLTKTATILGTPAYMSPEQARREPTGRQTDIWSLGVVIYEMVTGRLPFEGERQEAVLYAIGNEDPEPITALRASLPMDLEWIVSKSLAKDLEDRYQHIEDMLVDLRRLEKQLALPVAERVARRSVTRPAASPRWRRPGWRIAGIAVMGFAIAAFAGWYSRRAVDAWQNPLASAKFSRLTNFEGIELDAAISVDGKLVAFLADRDGPFDAWVGQIGTGSFVNLTEGRYPELRGPSVRSIGFSADGSHVWLRVRGAAPEPGVRSPHVWLLPTLGGGEPRLFLDSAVSVAWSPDGERIAYHEATPGDTIFVADRNGGNREKLFAGEPGAHCHHPTWSPDGRFIYFVSGFTYDDMDVWRVSVEGAEAERITNHSSTVSYPTLLDNDTLIYTATAEDGAGSCLYMMDVGARIPRRVSSGLEQYISVAADLGTGGRARRLVATLSNPTEELWSAPLTGAIADETTALRVEVPSGRATGPRLSPNYLLYLSSTGPADGLFKVSNGSAIELWPAADGGLAVSPAMSPDGRQICFSYRRQDKASLYLMRADGANVRLLTNAFQVRSAPSWSPDGKWIVVAGDEGNGSRVFKVPVEGGAPTRLVDTPSYNPLWSPDGRFIAYSVPVTGPFQSVKGITPDGQPFPLPDVLVRQHTENYRFLPDGKGLVFLQAPFQRPNFWLLDLETGKSRQLTDLEPRGIIHGFDVSPDGKRIVFDRVRENSDVVLIELSGSYP